MNDLCMYIVAVRSAPFGAFVGTHTDIGYGPTALLLLWWYMFSFYFSVILCEVAIHERNLTDDAWRALDCGMAINACQHGTVTQCRSMSELIKRCITVGL